MSKEKTFQIEILLILPPSQSMSHLWKIEFYSSRCKNHYFIRKLKVQVTCIPKPLDGLSKHVAMPMFIKLSPFSFTLHILVAPEEKGGHVWANSYNDNLQWYIVIYHDQNSYTNYFSHLMKQGISLDTCYCNSHQHLW